MTVLLSIDPICLYKCTKKGLRHNTADPVGNPDYKPYSSRFKHLHGFLLSHCTNRTVSRFKTNRPDGRRTGQSRALNSPFMAG